MSKNDAILNRQANGTVVNLAFDLIGFGTEAEASNSHLTIRNLHLGANPVPDSVPSPVPLPTTDAPSLVLTDPPGRGREVFRTTWESVANQDKHATPVQQNEFDGWTLTITATEPTVTLKVAPETLN